MLDMPGIMSKIYHNRDNFVDSAIFCHLMRVVLRREFPTLCYFVCVLWLTACFLGIPKDVEAVSPFDNLQVGTANGPAGRTNIQILADFEDGVLHTKRNPNPAGYYFAQNSHFIPAIVKGGPQGSQKALRLRQITGSYKDYSEWKYAQLFWTGPRQAYVQEARRANSMSFSVRGFDALEGDRRQNFVLGGYNRQDTPRYLNANDFESHNMHSYFQTIIDWGGTPGAWREIVYRGNPITQRYEQHAGGYEMFLDHAQMWPGLTRFYFQFDAGTPFVDAGEVWLDNIQFFYENPFLAAFPHVSLRTAQAGQSVIHPIVVWNTHPTASRNFHIQSAGWRGNDAGKELSLTTETGSLGPGQGFAFQVSFRVPEKQSLGSELILLLSVSENAAAVPNHYPYQQLPAIKNVIASRYDLPGVGIVLKTLMSSESTQSSALPPPGVSRLQAEQTGESWVDLTWASPAQTTDAQELSADPALMAYAIRYSHAPVIDEESWQAAVPVESVPPVFGAGMAQRYTIRGLNPDSQYAAAIRTYDESGEVSTITELRFTTIMDKALLEALRAAPREAPSCIFCLQKVYEVLDWLQ